MTTPAPNAAASSVRHNLLEALELEHQPLRVLELLLLTSTAAGACGKQLAVPAALAAVLDFYGRPSEAARTALAAGSERERSLVARIYAQIDLDQTQTLQLLRAAVGSPQPAALSDDEIVASCRTFYFQERLSTLQLLNALFRIGLDPDHQNYVVATKCIQQIVLAANADSARPADPPIATLQIRILNQLVGAAKATVPARFQFDLSLSQSWAVQNLNEQIELADLLAMAIYYVERHTLATAETILTSLYSISFGADQPNRSVFGENKAARVVRLVHLCNIVAIQALSLDDWANMAKHPENICSNGELQSICEIITRIDKIIWNSISNRQLHLSSSFDAAAVLAWATFIHLLVIRATSFSDSTRNFLFNIIDPNSHPDGHSPQKLVEIAYLNHRVFDLLAHALTLPPYTNERQNALVFKSTLMDLLNAFLTVQNVATLPSRESLIQFTSRLYSGEESLSLQFWNRDFMIPERRSLLDCARRHFPIEFSGLIDLVEHTISSQETAQSAFVYLSNITSFADFLRSGYGNDQTAFYANQIYIWSGGPLVAMVGTPIAPVFGAPAGTEATSVGQDVVLLNFQYSAWRLFESMLDSFINVPMNTNASGEPGPIVGTAETTVSILKLLGTFLKHADAETIRNLMKHLAQSDATAHALTGFSAQTTLSPPERLIAFISAILDRACQSRTSNIDLVTHCINCLRLMLLYYPSLVWRLLRSHMLLPKYSASLWLSQQYYQPHASSYIQRCILPHERSTGTYHATSAFLELVVDLVDQAQGVLMPQSPNMDETGNMNDIEMKIAPTPKASKKRHDDPFGGMSTPVRHASGRDEGQMDNMPHESAYDYKSFSHSHHIRDGQNQEAASIRQQQRLFKQDDLDARSDVLRSVVSFVVYEVFPTHRSWRYHNLMDRFRIGLQIVKVCTKVLGHVCWSNAATDPQAIASAETMDASFGSGAKNVFGMSASKAAFETAAKNRSVAMWSLPVATAAEVYKLVLSAFVEAESTQHVATLLDLAGTGNDALESMMRRRRTAEAETLESLVEESLRLLCLLVAWRIETRSQVSVVENMLLDRTVRRNISTAKAVTAYTASVGASDSLDIRSSMSKIRSVSLESIDLIRVIGRYVFYEQSRELQILALHLLALVCEAGALSQSKSVSFVGYFHDDVHPLIDTIVEILSFSDNSTKLYHVNLQRAALRFATAVVQSQPGFASEMFSDRSSLPGKDKFGNGTDSKGVRGDKHVSFSDSSSRDKNAGGDDGSDVLGGKSGAGSLPSAGGLMVGAPPSPLSPMIRAMLSIVKSWRDVLKARPHVLIATMRLFDVLWQDAPGHRSALDSLRKSEHLWRCLREILFKPVTEPTQMPFLPQIDESIEPATRLLKNISGLPDDEAGLYELYSLSACVTNTLRAYALRIVTLEAYFVLGTPVRVNGSTNSASSYRDVHRQTIRTLVTDIFKSHELVTAARRDFGRQDASDDCIAAFPLGSESLNECQAFCMQTKPKIHLNMYRIPQCIASATGSVVYGYTFLFDITILARQFMVYDTVRTIMSDGMSNTVGMGNIDATMEDIEMSVDAMDPRSIHFGTPVSRSANQSFVSMSSRSPRTPVQNMSASPKHGMTKTMMTKMRNFLLAHVAKLNWEWSILDSRMQLAQSSSLFLQVASSRLWEYVWSLPNADATASHPAIAIAVTGTNTVVDGDRELAINDQILDHLSRLTGMLEQIQDRKEVIVVRYRSMLASMVRALVGIWIKANLLTEQMNGSAAKSLAMRHLQVVEHVQRALCLKSSYLVGPVGYFSTNDHHIELMSALLVLLRAMNAAAGRSGSSKDQEPQDDTFSSSKQLSQTCVLSETAMANACGGLLPFVCQGVASLLSVDLPQVSQSQLYLGLGVMLELLERPELRASQWFAAFDRYNVLSLLITVVAKADAVLLHGSWDSHEMVLRLIVRLSGHVRFAERLAVTGLVTSIASSAFAGYMAQQYIADDRYMDDGMMVDGGTVDAMNATRVSLMQRGGVSQIVEGKMRLCWSLVLAVLTNQLWALGHHPQFVQELVGVSQLFMRYLIQTFSRVNYSDVLLLRDLDELERATGLLYALVDVVERPGTGASGAGGVVHGDGMTTSVLENVRESEPKIVDAVQNAAVDVLVTFLHLFMTPHEMERRVRAGLAPAPSGSGMDAMANNATVAVHVASAEAVKAAQDAVECSMRRIARNLLMILVTTTGAEAALTCDGLDASAIDRRIILDALPQMFPREGGLTFAAIGWLVEMSRERTGLQQSDKSAADEWLQVAESALVLACGQLAAGAAGDGAPAAEAARGLAAAATSMPKLHALVGRAQARAAIG